jgi:DNA-binding protein H-NS
MARTTVDAQLLKIRKQVEALEAKEKALLAKANDKVIAEIVALAKKHKVTIEELTAALGKGKTTRKAKVPTASKKASGNRAKVAPKYRNPEDATKTWTGRGKSPLWVQALKDAGILDSALIAAQ